MPANQNPKTGIRYGIISANNLHPDVIEELILFGSDVRWEEAVSELECNYRYGNLDDGETECDDIADEIERRIQEMADNWYDDEPIHEGKYEGVEYRTTWLGGALHVWIFESTVVGNYQQCSPCVPGAGNLDCPDLDGVVCYDIPKEWRADYED